MSSCLNSGVNLLPLDPALDGLNEPSPSNLVLHVELMQTCESIIGECVDLIDNGFFEDVQDLEALAQLGVVKALNEVHEVVLAK